MRDPPGCVNAPRVVEKSLVVRPDVEADGQALARRDSPDCREEEDLALADPHASGAKVAEAEDPLAVSDDADPDILREREPRQAFLTRPSRQIEDLLQVALRCALVCVRARRGRVPRSVVHRAFALARSFASILPASSGVMYRPTDTTGGWMRSW